MKEQIEYYELPNGDIVKHIRSDAAYRYNFNQKSWKIDHLLTAVYAWDKPFGKPCLNLRKKIDISCDLPPFPSEFDFYPGNMVLIGAYPQRSPYDYSPIEWIVLETDGTIATCISKDCLITSGYVEPQKAYGKWEMLYWENSLAREICNCLFFENAFSEAEKARIIPRKMTAVQLGKKCTDNVFLLSEQEVHRYFPQDFQKKAKPTQCAINNGARLGWTEETADYTSWWILPEENAYGFQDGSIYPKAVFQMGEIQFHGRNIYHSDFTIRPCIQIQYKNA